VVNVSKEDLAKKLVETGAVRFGKFKLTSGKESDYYVDIKQAYTDPAILRLMAKELAARMGKGADRVAGMELGAIPLVVALSMETGLPFLMVRKGERAHGTGKLVEGNVPPGGKVVVIEDVATTGGSLVKTVERLRAAGAKVERALVIVDRQEGGMEAARTAGIELLPVLTRDELMRLAPGKGT
jgi:orotate phosphoribosyltransferase